MKEKIKTSIRELIEQVRDQSYLEDCYISSKNGKSDGCASDRAGSSSYKIPDYDSLDHEELKQDRDYLRDLDIKSDETIYIPTSTNWKDLVIDLYGITSKELFKLGEKSREKGRLIKIYSIHGAAHSFQLLINGEESEDHELQADFACYIDVSFELPDERQMVLYMAREVFKVPLVIVSYQERADEFYYRKHVFPTRWKRWCTRDIKLGGLKKFFRYFFDDKVVNKGKTTKKASSIIQYLGIQAHQSNSRASMIPFPTVSKLSTERMIVFDCLPGFEKSEENNMADIKRIGAMRNPNERQFGKHGCLACWFSGWKHFLNLKNNYPCLYYIAKLWRDEASRHLIETEQRKNTYTVYRHSEFKKAMNGMEITESFY